MTAWELAVALLTCLVKGHTFATWNEADFDGWKYKACCTRCGVFTR